MSHLSTVSVIIPVYERLAVLEVVLTYFEYQDFPADRFEVILIDDGTPENIGYALRARQPPYRLEIVVQPNRGRAAARNAGVRCAAGDIVLFCDADRIPDSNLITTHVEFHRRWPRSAAVGVPWDCFLAFETIRGGQSELIPRMRAYSRLPAYYKAIGSLLPDDSAESPLAWIGFLVGNSSIRRQELLEVTGFDEELTAWGIEHFELAFRLMHEQNMTVRYMHKGESYHIPHARNPEYFRSGIDRAVEVLAQRPGAAAFRQLRSFLVGERSLQEFERDFYGLVSPQITGCDPIYFRELSRALTPRHA
jgi:glycosyltransferase involved in cell wall biosynthesis